MQSPMRLFTLAALVFTGCPDDGAPMTTGGVSAHPPPSAAPSVTNAASTPPSAGTASHAAAAPKTPARPLYYERPIEDADLEARTLRELSLLRNTIYARVGNSFRRPWLHAHFTGQSWYAPQEKMDESKITKLDRDNAKKIADHDASLTKEDLERMRDAVLARKKAARALSEDAVELSLLSQRLGTYLGQAREDAPPTPLEDHSQLDRLLKVEELSTLSRRDLRILRNTVFARRGRAFESKVVRSYFEGAAWYEPSADYHDGMLTGVDHKNVNIIRSVEDSLGGPLHENPNYGKDGWFIMA